MANLVKYKVGNPVFTLLNQTAPFSSDWDISDTAGKLDTSGVTTKAGAGGSGSGLTVRFTVSGSALTQIAIQNPGKGYLVGDTITFSFTAADAGFTGACDITLDPTTGETFLAQSRFDNGYLDADSIIAWTTDENYSISFMTNVREGGGNDQLSVKIAIAGIDLDTQEMVDAKTGISEAIKDAWQNPNSQPSLDDYLPDGGSIATVSYF